MPRSSSARIFAGLILAGWLTVALLPAQYSAPVTPQQGAVISPDIPVVPPGAAHRQTNLVSDLGGLALLQDPLLVNLWGISMTAASPFWLNKLNSFNGSFINAEMVKAFISSSEYRQRFGPS